MILIPKTQVLAAVSKTISQLMVENVPSEPQYDLRGTRSFFVLFAQSSRGKGDCGFQILGKKFLDQDGYRCS